MFSLVSVLDEKDREGYMSEMQIDDASIMAIDLEVDDRECLAGVVQVGHT